MSRSENFLKDAPTRSS